MLVANVALYVVLLTFRNGAEFNRFWDVWIVNLVMVLPITACVARAIVGGPRRAAAVWLGLATVAFGVGSVIYIAWSQFQTDPPVPSGADIAYLAFYPCVVAAVISLARQDIGRLAKSLWLDAALGAAGAATAMAAVLSPILSSTDGEVGVVLVGSAYTIGDLVIVAMICGLLAVRGTRGGSMWLWLAAGLAVFCAADVTYTLGITGAGYVTGDVLRTMWATGITIVAIAIWWPERPRATDSGRSRAILAVPTLATVTAVVVLVISSVSHLPAVVVALATFTLLLAAVRTFVSFRQVQRLSDAHRQAVTDELTGLGNRRYLFEYGAKHLAETGPDERLALILIDLDNFKEVNDTLGHHAGDELLREAARRLAARASGPDLLIRLGGDEFALVIMLGAGDDGSQIAERILDRLTEHFLIEGVRVRVDASAGVAESGDDAGIGIADLLRRADVAMYAAKSDSARVVAYAPQLDVANRTRLETIQDLDAALVNHQFVLHYQPKIEVKTGATVGAEALVRWQHPTRGLLCPDAFLPAVEQSGMMGALTRVVLESAIRQLAAWHRDGLVITLAVNLSASDLLDENLVERIERLLTAEGVPVSALELEITESVLITDAGRARQVLEQLRRLGVRIAVDDYGTGYSALAYLRDLPIDELKIDRSFIAHIASDPRSAAIVHSTIDLAHALGLKVVAEGVEDQDANTALAAFGCDYAQGYHFSRPLTADVFADWVQDSPLESAPRLAVPR